MSSLHKEIHFESDIAAHLEANGWLYSPDGAGYDRELALIPEDVIGWIRDTQPVEFNKLKALHNGSTEKTLLDRLTKLIDSDGVISVLRHGFKHIHHDQLATNVARSGRQR